MTAMIKLQVYVSDGCWSCAESRRMVAEMAPQFPQVLMELLDTQTHPLPDEVFAVPTYVLDGKVISLGNPYPADLRRKLMAAVSRSSA